jgi:hypothetical protein
MIDEDATWHALGALTGLALLLLAGTPVLVARPTAAAEWLIVIERPEQR